MRATKFTVEVTVQALSKDSIPGLLCEMAGHFTDENIDGNLKKDDGDLIIWKTMKCDVDF